ncbi:hypothetical protein SAMD00019534_070190 [Acytostelium subglobosum LB1]|uniref:hypothetical protein n=1 Tax=Acytostelium subglobosum LB1 TaxID=1410327 RepID=UPI0006448605|nr:hypothetical protein SAMD00019534_070190 [Acytostelium subglobosum LB1]GAM23844.1 hypothetical protein SAMD00019534_070190 [Acytostelium subglobosum LB1]|eukprot:XP_012752880.1 hypothetical protein SAMD00019534_070190 [Acytostelium subglobosum LB1]
MSTLLRRVCTVAATSGSRSIIVHNSISSSSRQLVTRNIIGCSSSINTLRSYATATATATATDAETETETQSEKSNIPFQFLSITKDQWNTNIGKECISKELQAHFDRIGKEKERATLLRQPVFKVIEWMNRMRLQQFVKTSKSDYAMLIDGKKGAGKSVALSQLVFWAKQQGWFVFYVPSCFKFIHTGTLTPFVENPMLFEQHELSTLLLNQMLEVNGEMMKQIPLKTKFKIQFNNFKSQGKTLYDLAASSMVDCSSEVLYHFKRELDCVVEFPVLVALDGYNHFHRKSGYGDMYDAKTFMGTLPTDRLLASNLFKPLFNHSLSNGIVVATTTDDVRKEQLLGEFEESMISHIPKFSLYEMRLLINYLVDIQYLEKIPSQETVQYLWQLSSGNAREVWRFVSLL